MYDSNAIVVALAQLTAAVDKLAKDVRAGNKHLETLVGLARQAKDGRRPPRDAEVTDDGVVVFKAKGRRAGTYDNGGEK